jgi:hypothetical protein
MSFWSGVLHDLKLHKLVEDRNTRSYLEYEDIYVTEQMDIQYIVVW